MLVSVPNMPLDVIAMPEFKRGVAIAYCDAPGPLEKNGKTFFAVAPTPKDWSKERKESFFREYNNYMIRDLTVHEAMPGIFCSSRGRTNSARRRWFAQFSRADRSSRAGRFIANR